MRILIKDRVLKCLQEHQQLTPEEMASDLKLRPSSVYMAIMHMRRSYGINIINVGPQTYRLEEGVWEKRKLRTAPREKKPWWKFFK